MGVNDKVTMSKEDFQAVYDAVYLYNNMLEGSEVSEVMEKLEEALPILEAYLF